MSNEVVSIAHRHERKSLIRGQGPQFSFKAPSLNAMRLVLALLFRVRAKTDPGFEQFTFSIPQLGGLIGLGYRMSREQAWELLQDVLPVYLTYRCDGENVGATFMALCKLDAAGVVHLKVNPDLEPYLLNLRENYRQLHPVVLKLRSPYSVLLYIFLRKFIGLRWLLRPTVPLDELFKAMQLPADRDWFEFHKEWLKPAAAEINLKTELHIEYEAKRTSSHRKRGGVEGVIFQISERKGTVEKEPAGGIPEATA